MQDNPQAFPKPTAIVDHYVTRGGAPTRKEIECAEGMTLRDWFAGQALAMLPHIGETTLLWDEWAHEAYALADAMLTERNRNA